MNTHSMNTTKLKMQVALLAIVSLALIPSIATAHGGEEHVTGTVTKISDTSVTVKTTAGKTVEVGILDAGAQRRKEARFAAKFSEARIHGTFPQRAFVPIRQRCPPQGIKEPARQQNAAR